MKPNSVHVKKLEEFDANGFAGWLQSGFIDINNDSKRATAFAPLHYFVLQGDDLFIELRDIFDVLSGSAQKNMQLGIAIALSNTPPRPQSINTVRSLLHLAGALNATEVLPIVVQMIGNGFFGMKEHDAGREFFALTLDIVSGMTPSLNIGNTLRRLVGSSFFYSDYAPRAFIALCKAEPEVFYEHLELLRGDFERLHVKEGTQYAYITANRFVQYVDTRIIADNIWRMNLSIDPHIPNYRNDHWLGYELFLGDKAPLLIDRDEDGFLISRTNKDNNTTWRININDELSTWDQVNSLREFLNVCFEINQRQRWNVLKVQLSTINSQIIHDNMKLEKVRKQDQSNVIDILSQKDSPITSPFKRGRTEITKEISL